MFVIGTREPLLPEPTRIERLSIVWVGSSHEENSIAIGAAHPLCSVVLRLQALHDFVGSWVMAADPAGLSPFQARKQDVRLRRGRWAVARSSATCICAYRQLTSERPWPHDDIPGFPAAGEELLLLGTVGTANISCASVAGPRRPVPGENLALTPAVLEYLVATESTLLCLGRTHTDSCPGLSLISHHTIDPALIVPKELVHATIEGADAEWAWSYGRLPGAPPSGP